MKQSSIYTNDNTVVMFLQGKKYKVTVNFEFNDRECGGMPTGGKITIVPTDEELTVSLDNSKGRHYRDSRYLYKFGGFPSFIQNAVEPAADDGCPYDYICTIENGWGDSGNGNLFALIRNGVVEDVYVEASCC